MDITGRVVLVTGASSGIGESTVRLAHQRGARVVMVGRRAERLDALAEELPGALPVPLDVTENSAPAEIVRRVIEHFGRIDVLINNAGRGLHEHVLDSDPADVRTILELNLLAALRMMQTVVPGMRGRGEGVVINVSSGVTLVARSGTGAYGATKAALEQLTAVARAELAPAGVVVSALLPSLTQTEFPRAVQAGPTRSPNEIPPNLPFEVQSPEYVAEQILALVNSGEARSILGYEG